jgi:hypothetical protein
MSLSINHPIVGVDIESSKWGYYNQDIISFRKLIGAEKGDQIEIRGSSQAKIEGWGFLKR